ncbi:LysR family transcriptional regulator [Microvirga sp. W0021]|uniref:LysR family transcriptional regulator n=1 Tax=Hohaiivirga grylli TaxID=3133970 RepID=A0ABV0BL88_9HYPH
MPVLSELLLLEQGSRQRQIGLIKARGSYGVTIIDFSGNIKIVSIDEIDILKMRYAPEALEAFVEAAALGSFSSAARKLGKTQSTVSTAIANLEIDLGLTLFSRDGRYPVLTEAGHKVLGYAHEILAASDRLEELSIRMADEVEARLTIVISDIYQLNPDQGILRRFEKRFPDIELEYLDAERADVLDLLQTGRAQLGLLAAQSDYPSDIIARRLPERVEMAVYVGRKHPLAAIPELTSDHLARYRHIYLNTYAATDKKPGGLVWSASDYLMVLEMAEEGFGWAELPRSLVKQYGRGRLVELKLNGWPRPIAADVAWSKHTPPGPAGFWLLDQFVKGMVDRSS